MRKGAIVITFLLACNVVQAQQPFHRSFLFTEKDSTMRYSSEEYYTGKIKSKTLHLQQHLIINTNLTLDYDTISIYSNKQIIVQSGYTLTIQNSILYACKDMWSGIRLEPGAQLIIQNTLILDADTAILSRSNADNTDAYGYYQLNYVTFNKNRYGVVQMPHPDISNTHINIRGCTFDCQSNIQWSAGNNLKAPYSSEKSHTAIVMDMSIDEPVLTLGDASSGANKNNFYRHRYGIRSMGGRFTLVNSLMQYLYSTQACNAIDAVGLWHKGGHLYVQQINNLYNYFDYCKVGVLYEDGGNHSVNISGNIFTNIGNGLSCTLGQIKAIGAVWVRQSSTLNLNINSNEISFCERGIRVVNCPYSNITAKYNQIENCKYGIGIAETESSDVMVYENEINQLNLPATYGMEGINISQIVGIPASVTIENNHIRKVRSGIVGNNCGMMLIQNNQIQFPQNISGAVKYGIRINNCNDAQVLNNIILKDGAVAQYGQQNQLFGITAELCTGIRVYNNIIARCGTAIRILGDSTGGLNAEAQLKCNRMIDYFYGVRLDAAGIGAQGNETTPSDNRWEIGINNNTIGIYDYYAVSSLSSEWWVRDLSGRPWWLNSWLGFFNAYSINDTSIATTCTFDFTVNYRRGEYASMIRNRGRYSLDSINTANDYQNKWQVYHYIIHDSTYLSFGDTLDVHFTAFADTFQYTVAGVIGNINAYLRQGDTLQAQQYLANLVPGDSAEYVYREVLLAYEQSWARGNELLDSTVFSTLHQYAIRNPHTSGSAVFMARTMTETAYDDFLIEQQNSRHSETEADSIAAQYLLYPNPTGDGLLRYVWKQSEEGNKQLSIYDAQGKLLQQLIAEGKEGLTLLNLNSYPAGIYLLQLHCKGTLCNSQKIIKQ